MTCEEVRARLDDWVEGKLDETEAESVAAHVAACDACRAEARSLKALLAAAADLPRDVRPPRELWTGIDARLADPPATPLVDAQATPLAARRPARRAGLPGWALVAAALALVVVTAAVTSILTRNPEAIALKPVRAGEAASRELLAGLEAQELSPETMEIVRRNLEVIDAAIAELQAALEDDPGNGELTRMLLATYQRKIELLEQAARSTEG
jgi:hypothetical protein